MSRLIRDLLEGDYIAWAILVGGVPGILLGFLASKAKIFQGKKKTDPDEIIAESQKRCARTILPGLGVFVATILIPFVLGDSFIGWVVAYFFGSSLLALIVCVNARCPACRSIVSDLKIPEHCPKCGVRLK